MELFLALAGFIVGVIGLIATFYFGYRQRQRARVQVEISVEAKQFDPRQERDTVYSNPNADKAIDINICVRSRHKTPIHIQSFVVTVPKLLQSTKPPFLIKNWPVLRITSR